MLRSRLILYDIIGFRQQCCCFSSKPTSTPITGKGKVPWDKRFPVNAKDLAERRRGGRRRIQKILTEHIVPPTGVVDRLSGKFIPVKEMVPEFVVPDLEGFELKPYVSYLAKEIKQSKITSKDIFNSVYAAKIEDAYHEGKIKVEDGKVKLEDGTILDLEMSHEDHESAT